jgi:hypothetical protein
LVDRSIVKSNGIVEDVVILVESWEYPAYFMFLQPKASLDGYSIILGWPWLETIVSYIGCRFGSMTIAHGRSTKKISLYPLTKPSIDPEAPIWVDDMEDEDKNEEVSQQVLLVDQYLVVRENMVDGEIIDFIASTSSSS